MNPKPQEKNIDKFLDKLKGSLKPKPPKTRGVRLKYLKEFEKGILE